MNEKTGIIYMEGDIIHMGESKIGSRLYKALKVKKMFPSLYNNKAKLNSKIEEGILHEVV